MKTFTEAIDEIISEKETNADSLTLEMRSFIEEMANHKPFEEFMKDQAKVVAARTRIGFILNSEFSEVQLMVAARMAAVFELGMITGIRMEKP